MPDVHEWAVVVPVKRLPLAKSRLAPLPAGTRAELALAMALDTVAAALACPAVALVVAVSDDPVAAPRLRALGASVVADEPDAGLNPALRHGAQHARTLRPGVGVASLSSDLPALRPSDLAGTLAAAVGHDTAVVADLAGTGTTLLTARDGVDLDARYGPRSLARHVAAGAVVLDAAEGLRRDVDTLADLAAARTLGVGRHTAAVLGTVALPPPA